MRINKFVLVSVMVSLLAFACEESVDNSDTGRLLVKLTDDPFPTDLVSQANVKITKIEIRKAQSELEGNPFIVLSEETFIYNLLELRNGITADLVDIEVPAGDYDLVRLYVDSAGIQLKDDREFGLKVPSGSETGIKIFIDPSISVVGGLTAELVLDFEVSQSFIVQGDPYSVAGINGFIFTPVIHAANASTTGSLDGTVKDSESNLLDNADVWIDNGGDTYSTSSSMEGYYMFSNIPAGDYTLNATKKAAESEYDTASIENIEVVAGNIIQLDDLILTKK
jgi:hypothetical protein